MWVTGSRSTVSMPASRSRSVWVFHTSASTTHAATSTPSSRPAPRSIRFAARPATVGTATSRVSASRAARRSSERSSIRPFIIPLSTPICSATSTASIPSWSVPARRASPTATVIRSFRCGTPTATSTSSSRSFIPSGRPRCSVRWSPCPKSGAGCPNGSSTAARLSPWRATRPFRSSSIPGARGCAASTSTRPTRP